VVESSQLTKKVEEYDQVELLKDFTFDSFVLIKINADFVRSKYPEEFRFEHVLSYKGHILEITYSDSLGNLDKLCDCIEKIDENESGISTRQRKYFEIFFQTPIDLNQEQGHRLLQILLDKRCGRINCEQAFRSEESYGIMTKYLIAQSGDTNGDTTFSPPTVIGNKVNALELKLKKTSQIVEILEATNHNYFLEFVDLETDAKVSKEIEEIALKHLEPRIGYVIELNTNNKLLRPSKQRGVIKYTDI